MTEEADVQILYERLNKDAESRGYRMNPDVAFTKSLVQGLLVNDVRYGYISCPCRLSTGKRMKNVTSSAPATAGIQTSTALGPATAGYTFPKKSLKASKSLPRYLKAGPYCKSGSGGTSNGRPSRHRPAAGHTRIPYGAARYAAIFVPGNRRPISAQSAT